MGWPPGREDEFGDVIQKARQGLGLSLDETALMVEIDTERLKDLERYVATPKNQEIARLSWALGLNPLALGGLVQSDQTGMETRLVGETWAIYPMVSDANAYLCLAGDEAVLIDAGCSLEAVTRALEGRRLGGILLTHEHSDHTRSAQSIAELLGAPIHHPHSGPTKPLDLAIGQVWDYHTPGHTPTSRSYLWQMNLFTGDLLFAGSAGRAQNYAALLSSLGSLLQLPEQVQVFPGHGPGTTIGRERKHNPFNPI